jgi:DNA-binding beta-propeller fold protein YncE
MLAGSIAAGAAATAGCAGADPDTDSSNETDGGGDGERSDTVFVFNTGDKTVSVVNVASDEVVATPQLRLTASFPANQYAPGLTDEETDPLWLNVDEGVRAVEAGTLSAVAAVETGTGANWQEVTPDGRHLVVSAREPSHAQYRVDADPESDSFGEVTGTIDRANEGGRGDNDGPGPCDVTIHPGGEYAYVPDLYGDTLTVVDVESFEIETQVEVDPAEAGTAPAPWMGTAARDGETLLVENNEGATGTESIWDVSDPANPQEVTRLTSGDGLGHLPLTSEIGPDSAVGYVFTPDTEDISVIDIEAGEVAERIALNGKAFVGTWDPAHRKLYVPVQTAGEVAVVDHAAREVTETLDVGPEPYGATAATVRPESDGASGHLARLQALGLDPDSGTTYCLGECSCGHEW